MLCVFQDGIITAKSAVIIHDFNAPPTAMGNYTITLRFYGIITTEARKKGMIMPRILIVDDDMHLRKLVLTYGEMDGFTCEEAENATQALEKIENTQYALVLLGVMMPGIDGFELLTEIRKHSQVPVIMLTSRAEEYDKLFGFNLGADDYVSKPFSPKELMARMGAVLKRSGRKQADQLRFGELRNAH